MDQSGLMFSLAAALAAILFFVLRGRDRVVREVNIRAQAVVDEPTYLDGFWTFSYLDEHGVIRSASFQDERADRVVAHIGRSGQLVLESFLQGHCFAYTELQPRVYQ